MEKAIHLEKYTMNTLETAIKQASTSVIGLRDQEITVNHEGATLTLWDADERENIFNRAVQCEALISWFPGLKRCKVTLRYLTYGKLSIWFEDNKNILINYSGITTPNEADKILNFATKLLTRGKCKSSNASIK